MCQAKGTKLLDLLSLVHSGPDHLRGWDFIEASTSSWIGQLLALHALELCTNIIQIWFEFCLYTIVCSVESAKDQILIGFQKKMNFLFGILLIQIV